MSAVPFRRLALVVAALVAVAGCTCKTESPVQPQTGPQPGATPGPAATPSQPAEETPPAPPTAAALLPDIRPWGEEGEVPQKLLIELSAPIAPASKVGQPAYAKTRFQIAPDVKGQLTITGERQLTFLPDQPLPFGTGFDARLDAIETAGGVVQAPSAGAWSASFRTPEFAFLRMSPRQIDYRRRRVTMRLLFSGAVKPDQVRDALRFDIGSQGSASFTLTQGDAPNALDAVLSGSGVQPNAAVRLAVSEGIPAAADPQAKAKAASATVTLPGGKPVQILAAHLAEGEDGFYVEVICKDDASGGERWYYDRITEDGYYVSRRCQLGDSDARQLIRFSPAVDFSVAPGSGGFRLMGHFKRGALSLSIAAGATSIDGGVLMQAWTQDFTVPQRSPKIRFTSNGRYLPRAAWKNLAVQHTNVDELEISIRQVPLENLVFWLSQDGSESADERTSDLLVTRKLKVQNPPDEQVTTYVDLAAMLPSTTRGILEITAKREGAQAVSRLLLTNLSLVAKKSLAAPGAAWKQEVYAWALDIESTRPVGGVHLDLKRKSGKSVATCITSSSGGCLLKVGDAADADTTEPFIVTASQGDDFTYIRYSDLRTDTSAFEVAGEPYLSDRVYRASVWSDRGVYRPGETAHVAALLRDRDNVAPKTGLPVDVKLHDPRGQLVKQVQIETNPAGMLQQDFPFASFQDTGQYKVVLEVAKKTVASYAFNVEEFVPERMKVDAKPLDPAYALGDKAQIGVAAQYLFGGSAEGSRVQVSCRLEASVFKPKENGQYQYGVFREDGKAPKPVVLGDVEGSLDAKGQAALECPQLASPGAFNGPAKLVAGADVFEAGSGRSTHGEVSVPVHPEKYYVGLLTGVEKFEANKPIKAEGVIVDWNGALATEAVSSVDVEFIRLEPQYGYWWDEDEGAESYRHSLRPMVEGHATASVVGGKFTVNANPTQGGAAYVIRVRSGGAQTDLKIDGNESSYWWWGDRQEVDQTPKPLKPSTVALTLPAEIKVGQSNKATFKAPFKGRALLTVEADRVLSSEWKDVKAGEVSWSFEVDRFVPNVYVSAFIVKDPHLEAKESFLPDRAFGVGGARVAPVEFEQKLALDVPKEIRSNSKLDVHLDLGPLGGPTFATVAVVDEGILSLTRFKSPNPFDDIFTRRALGVETYETIGWTLLMPPQGNTSRTGGDEEGGEGAPGRVQPVKPVALWSGLLEVPADGKLTVPFDVPQYRGRLRVMAVASGPKKMARASANVTVSDPLVLQTTLPRFVLQGDVMQIPVFLTNMSGAPQDVKVSLTAEPLPIGGAESFAQALEPLQFLGKKEGAARLENGKSATLVFQARAMLTVGAAKLKVVAKSGPYESHEELDVPFLPNGPQERTVQRLELASGELDLKPYLAGWVPTSERSTFWVTANPYGESFDHLAYLIRYPYGCIEQTTSSTRPLLFVSQLLQNVDPTLIANKKIEDMVMFGVNRVLSMQTPSGGFGYWLGDPTPTAWGSAYATHMLLDAQKAGYPVPQDRLDRVLSWLQTESTRYANGKAAEYGDHGWSSNAESYIHYVLALAGRGDKARIQRLIEDRQNNPKNERSWSTYYGSRDEELYMLKAALWAAGDRRYEGDLKHPDVSPIQQVRHNSWSFYSDQRRRGFMLSTFQDLFGNDPAGEALAQRVADGLKGHRSYWYTTQELVWGITGLGKRIQNASKDFDVGALVANGKALKQSVQAKGADRTWSLYRASEYDKLSLDVKDTGKGKVFLILSSEGVRQGGAWKFGGRGLSISRRYRTLDGAEIHPSAGMNLADLAFVEIQVSNRTGDRVQNLALVDRLPASWEIENPRLGRGSPVSWLDPERTWKVDAMNVRDDRLEAFGTLNAGETKSVVYAVRAVTSGTFTLPPVEIQAMYDPELWAREPGGKVVVNGDWKDFLL